MKRRWAWAVPWNCAISARRRTAVCRAGAEGRSARTGAASSSRPGRPGDVQARDNLQRRLDELQRVLIVDPRTGSPIQRHIADPRGNIAFEPLGGSTVSGQNPVDTHTLYPNGSNYHRMNPQRHGSGKPPHAHGHLMGTGPNTKGQGPSLDIRGNIVPWNSPDAHWPMRK